DLYPRTSAWLHEARREGFNTPATIDSLLHDERFQAKKIEITRRANKEAIDYGALTPFERNVVKRAIFFYPWIRAATLYSLRYPLPAGQSRVGAVGQQLEQLIPAVTLAKRVQQRPSQATNPAKQPIYKGGTRAGVGRFLIGGLYPTPYNKAALRAKGEAEYT